MLTYAKDGTATITGCRSFFCSAFAKRVHDAYILKKKKKMFNDLQFALPVTVSCLELVQFVESGIFNVGLAYY